MDGASLPAFCPVKSCKHSAALMASFSTIHITTFSAILGTTFPHPIAHKLEFLSNGISLHATNASTNVSLVSPFILIFFDGNPFYDCGKSFP